jgi:L-asparaginase
VALLLIATGGTISLQADGPGAPRYGGRELLALVESAASGHEVVVEDVSARRSGDVTLGDMRELAALVADRSADVAGVVITHGTDTLEEVAYALALQLEPTVPVVLTGAMRRASHPGFDGVANLIAAFEAAGCERLAGCGPVVVLNDEVHAARWVAKAHTTSLAAFASPGAGPIGRVTEGGMELLAQPPAGDHLGLPEALDKHVELVWATAGADGRLVEAAASAADGLVIAGFGGGRLSAAMADAAVAAAARLPVVIASRCGAGSTQRSSYQGHGSETQLLAEGLIGAGQLNPLKARLRLAVALSLGLNPVEHFDKRARQESTHE